MANIARAVDLFDYADFVESDMFGERPGRKVPTADPRKGLGITREGESVVQRYIRLMKEERCAGEIVKHAEHYRLPAFDTDFDSRALLMLPRVIEQLAHMHSVARMLLRKHPTIVTIRLCSALAEEVGEPADLIQDLFLMACRKRSTDYFAAIPGSNSSPVRPKARRFGVCHGRLVKKLAILLGVSSRPRARVFRD